MKLIIAILLVILIFSKNVLAALKLNEIYPAPPSGEYEWVELYNDENQIIDISQYQLLDLAGNKIKISTQSAFPFDFILATSSSVLNNTGDTVSLKNNLEEIIEIATYSGTFDSSKIFTKCPDFDGDWFVLNLLTKNASNQTACQSLTPMPTITPTLTVTPTIIITPIPTATPTFTPTPTSIPQSYDNIFISEAMVNPTTGEKEWIEIYNNNDFPVSLNNWYIDDLENGGSSPKIFSLEINAKGYGIFDLTSSIFNNDGDSVRLLDFNKNLKDDFEYGKTEQGKTLGRTSLVSDDFCLQEPSKNLANNPCINPTPTPITSVKTRQINLSPTINVVSKKIPIYTGQARLTPTMLINQTGYYPLSQDVLGLSTKINHNNSSLINLLSFLSISYSLLTIISIFFKMKLIYGKGQKFYSSFIRSS